MNISIRPHHLTDQRPPDYCCCCGRQDSFDLPLQALTNAKRRHMFHICLPCLYALKDKGPASVTKGIRATAEGLRDEARALDEMAEKLPSANIRITIREREVNPDEVPW